MIDCTKVRKITIDKILPNGEVENSVIYFNIQTGNQLTSKEASKCPNIESLTFSCAVICNNEPDNNCWLTVNDNCWITEDGNFWQLP